MEDVVKDQTGYTGALILGAALSLAAGVLHATVIPEHMSEWWGYGFFFMLAALAQIMYGLLLFLRPWAYDETGAIREHPDETARPVYLGGALANLAIIALYLITRTVGIPIFGPDAGSVEPVTAVSVVVTLLEAALVAVLFVLARRAVPAMAPELVRWDTER